jgi:ketosteroid isomerase-like protein
LPSENVEIAQRAYAAFNHAGVEGILGYLDPEIEWRMWEEFARGSRLFEGHQGVREVLGIFAENFDEFGVEPSDFVEEGDRVIVSVCLSGTVKGSGEVRAFDLVHSWRLRGGRAVCLDVYGTREEALGAARSPSTGPGRAK